MKPDNQPHLAPLWYIWKNNLIYVCTPSKSVKVKNLNQNKNVTISLEDGSKPLIGEGTAILIEKPDKQDVLLDFKEKYDWTIVNDKPYDTLIVVKINKWIHFNG